MADLINHDQLQQATGCKTKESLEKTLRAQKVRFLYGQNGKLFTTLDAINAAMGIKPDEPETHDIEFRR